MGNRAEGKEGIEQVERVLEKGKEIGQRGWKREIGKSGLSQGSGRKRRWLATVSVTICIDVLETNLFIFQSISN